MIIDTKKIDKIIRSNSYLKLMELSSVSKSTATKWKTGELDWRKSKFETIERLVENYSAEDVEE